MDSLWNLIKKVKGSATSYESRYHRVSSRGRFSVEADEKRDGIYFSEKGRVELSDGSVFEATNYTYWKKVEDGIEYYRRRIDGYEKLFTIDSNGQSVSPHT